MHFYSGVRDYRCFDIVIACNAKAFAPAHIAAALTSSIIPLTERPKSFAASFNSVVGYMQGIVPANKYLQFDPSYRTFPFLTQNLQQYLKFKASYVGKNLNLLSFLCYRMMMAVERRLLPF